jgi:hypothetical protein
MLWKACSALLAVALLTACETTSPTPESRLTVSQPAMASPGVVHSSGGFIVRGSGELSIPIAFQSGREVQWAQLSVYLLTTPPPSTEPCQFPRCPTGVLTYCAQNLPDAPTWGGLDEGQQAVVTVSGFQVRTPCQVTGILAVLHTRNNGLLIPPTESETIASATIPASFTVQ